MAIARDGEGVLPTVEALASQVHPVFMLPPLAGSWFGALLTSELNYVVGAVHMAAMFFAVYTAHVKDGYVDFYRREEDDDHPMTEWGCRAGLVGSTVGFLCCLVYLGATVGVGAVLVTLPTWFLGFFHAPQLDMNPITATTGYPAGIALAILGGHYVQVGGVTAVALAFACIFFTILTGVKVIDDAQDYDYDRSIRKRTVPVVLGRRNAHHLSYFLIGLGLMQVVWFAVDGLVPPSSVLAIVAFGAVAFVSRRSDPKIATMLLIRGAYLFLALLLVAVWFRPVQWAGVALPDLGVLGGSTYLVTEVAFGTLAFSLLAYAGAVKRAARTIAVVYPLAYVWDWYTLSVGVFEIPLRTGATLFGIPIEEHLFMIVVPALVLGVHETIRETTGRRRSSRTDPETTDTD